MKKTNKTILLSGSATFILGIAAVPDLSGKPENPGFKTESGNLFFLALMIPAAIILTAALFRRLKYSKKKL